MATGTFQESSTRELFLDDQPHRKMVCTVKPKLVSLFSFQLGNMWHYPSPPESCGTLRGHSRILLMRVGLPFSKRDKKYKCPSTSLTLSWVANASLPFTSENFIYFNKFNPHHHRMKSYYYFIFTKRETEAEPDSGVRSWSRCYTIFY